MILTITKEDVERAQELRGNEISYEVCNMCVVALAAKRQLGPSFFAGSIWIQSTTHRKTFTMSPQLQEATRQFDQTGEFTSGDYELTPVS